MVGVLTRPESEGERFLGALKEAGPSLRDSFQMAMRPGRERGENERLKQLTGRDYSGLSPDIKELLLKGQMSAEGKAAGHDQGPALQALSELEGMIGQKGIGISGVLNTSGDARYNRGKFQSLQAAVLPLFKGMFPRGMTEKEFKFIQANYIPQYHDSEEKIRGKIDGLKRIVGGDLSQIQNLSPMSQEEPIGKQAFSNQNAEHRKKAEQLFRKYKDKEKVREALAREYEF